MRYQLTISESALRQLMDGFRANPTRIATCPAGVSHLPDRMEFLVHTVRWLPGNGRHDLSNLLAIASRPRDETTPLVFIFGVDRLANLTGSLHSALAPLHNDTPTVLVALGIGEASGHIAGICRIAHGIEPLHTLNLVGTQLVRVPLQDLHSEPAIPHSVSNIWSRTIGALGEPTYRRLVSLHPCIVGCGRSGSLVATALARLGIQHLTLIDPDTLEPHNLGEMDAVTHADLGKPKVEAMAQQISTFSSCCAVPLADSILSFSALVAVKRADLLFCCVDNPIARLATAFLATLYLKPLLDIGTGIFFQGWERTMGADIRLVLPNRCLLCFGGIANLEQARTELMHPTTPNSPQDWGRQRAGSLRSLNTLAVGFALRLLEDYISGRVRESIWLHLEFNEAGIPTLERPIPPSNPRCPLCSLAGQGDEGIGALKELVSRS